MGIFGSLVFPHFVYAFWQYLLYNSFYEESSVIPPVSSLQSGHYDSSPSFLKSFLLDSALQSHTFELMILRRAMFDANERITSSAYSSERNLLNKKDIAAAAAVDNSNSS